MSTAKPSISPRESQAGALHPNESAGAAAAIAPGTPLAALLTGHILRDGELVLLLLRPSRWFILLTSLPFLAAVAILMVLPLIFDEKLHRVARQSIESGFFLMACRIMFATLQWTARLYILTDLRIIRVSGVFNIHIFDCPLRKVARTLLEVPLTERLCRIGSIIIIPQSEDSPLGTWRMIAKPRQVHDVILSTIARAKQGHF